MDPMSSVTGMIEGASQAVGGTVKAIGSLFGGGKRRREQRRARAELKREKQEFQNLDVSNPYADITNPYQNLTVNTQAADFAAQQTAQGSANIMSNLAASAGGGGIAALAQSLANSQAQAAQQASAGIAQQEQRNQMLGAQGESSRQMAIASGETQAQKMQYEKQSTLLGMAQSRKTAADEARAAATEQLVGGISDVAAGGAKAVGNAVAGGFISDRRLKKNIKLIGSSPSGLKIYAFEYINKIFGKGTWQGVMSDEIPQNAVIKHSDGFDRVDYSKLDVEFKQI
jgi:hypothetical protein